MKTKVLQILEGVKRIAGDEAHKRLTKVCGELDPAAKFGEQAAYLCRLLREIESSCGPEMASKVIKSCGCRCLPEAAITKAKAALSKAEELTEFLILLNEQHIGGGNLHIQGDKIIAVYDNCYCELPNQVEGLPPVYCNCSVGWLEHLFTSVFEMKAEGIKLETILEGAEQCKLAITGVEGFAKVFK